MQRWLVVFGALLIQLCLGAIYAWSAFTQALTTPLAEGGVFGFTCTQSQAIFSVELATFAVVMVLAGRWQAKVGPRLVAALGGVLLGVGYISASFVGQTLWGQLFTIGSIGGAGIGLAYVCPIAVGIQWFPDRKGMITGITVAGFGFGALIWVKLAGDWGHLIQTHGVLGTYRIFGVAFLIAVVIGSIWMVKPKEYEMAAKGVTGPGIPTGMLPGKMLRTPQFYMTWLTFAIGAMAGLMVIGIIKLFSIDSLTAAGMEAAKASAVAGTAMGVFYAIFNGLGRLAWGSLSDKLGRKRSVVLMCLFQGIMMFAFYFALSSSEWPLYVGAALLGFNFGGNFALFPALTADLFGAATVGRNYGWVFSSYGVGGIIGPMMAGHFKDMGMGRGVGAWMPAFVIAGIALVVVALLMSRLKPVVAGAEN
ncbi:MAG TPA: OFA family MFS transporter [Thermoanaerobaculaceae bacterium]|nr:OFA family MFS transporter [Thermoanaerobaculaceae bacterium]